MPIKIEFEMKQIRCSTCKKHPICTFYPDDRLAYITCKNCEIESMLFLNQEDIDEIRRNSKQRDN